MLVVGYDRISKIRLVRTKEKCLCGKSDLWDGLDGFFGCGFALELSTLSLPGYKKASSSVVGIESVVSVTFSFEN